MAAVRIDEAYMGAVIRQQYVEGVECEQQRIFIGL
jgi:hypothetical protein